MLSLLQTLKLTNSPGMSDPSFQESPIRSPPPQTANQQQLHADELYARQLAEHYSASNQNRSAGSGVSVAAAAGTRPHPPQRTHSGNPPAHVQPPSGQSRQQQPSHNSDDRDYSFFDDELPVIQQNLKQGFLQTQTRVNKWISDFRRRIDGDESADGSSDPLYADQSGQQIQPARHNFGASQASQLRGIQRLSQQQQQQQQQGDAAGTHAGASARRNRSADRYDADPKELGDNLDELYLDDDHIGAAASAESTPPPKPPRPLANPDLFRSSATSGVRAPQSGPVDEVDALVRTPADRRKSGSLLGAAAAAAASPAASSGGKSKKWQPLTSVAPAPEADAGEDDEADPFSLGDDEDDDVAGQGEAAKGQDLLQESSARLKAAAAGKDEGRRMSLEPKEEGSGTRDKEAEKILKG